MTTTPLSFHPTPGSIVICDYSTGFRPPEMVKVRSVVVISPRRRSGNLATVLPISSSVPDKSEPWHVELPLGVYPPAHGPVWVKADMIATVGLGRLDRVRIRNADGTRAYKVFQVDAACMSKIQAAVKAALSLP